MKVTKIQQQVKRSDRYSIYIDEKYSFSLSDYQLVGSGIRVGKVFTEAQLGQFLQESNFGRAYERALNYVMIRPRSEKEIREYLTRTFLYPRPKVFTDKSGQRQLKKQQVNQPEVKMMIERVMSRLEEKGYINDVSFAKAWVNSRQLTKKSSRRKLQQELRAKGVSLATIDAALQDEALDESHNLKALITKKQRLSRYRDETKLTQYLLRQGFLYEDIKSALEE